MRTTSGMTAISRVLEYGVRICSGFPIIRNIRVGVLSNVISKGIIVILDLKLITKYKCIPKYVLLSFRSVYFGISLKGNGVDHINRRYFMRLEIYEHGVT